MGAVAVASSKVMGSDGFGRDRVTGKGVEARESGGVFISPSPVIDGFAALSCQKEDTTSLIKSDSWNEARCVYGSKQLVFQSVEVSERPLLFISRPEIKELSQGAEKVPKTSSRFGKRTQVIQMKDSSDQPKDNDLNKLGHDAARCSYTEKNQVEKLRNNLNGRRGDKRTSKVLSRSKCESLSSNLAANPSSFFGIYGLKSDGNDATKHEDELPISILLDCNYSCSSSSKDKGRKTANLNENVLQSVRKACSILQLPTRVHSRNSAEVDYSPSKKNSPCLLSSDPCIGTSLDSDKGDPHHQSDSAANDKVEDSCSKLMCADTADFPLYHPKEVLDRLALVVPKDLESLLSETASTSSRSSVSTGSSKPVSYRNGLPPFPWSHSSGGHCRTGSDAAKPSTSRSSCQVRWVRIGNNSTSLGSKACSFTDLESLTYDHNLVPLGGQSLAIQPVSTSLPNCEHGSPSTATCSTTWQVPPGFGGIPKYQENALHSPRALAAAQTLCDITTSSSKLKRPFGAIKVPDLRSSERPEEMPKQTESFIQYGNVAECGKQMSSKKPKLSFIEYGNVAECGKQMSSKKPKLSPAERRKDIGFARTFLKGPLSWSTPRSSRSSPIKLLNESLVGRSYFGANSNTASLVSPPTRGLDEVRNGQQKLRKLVPMDWTRKRSKLD